MEADEHYIDCIEGCWRVIQSSLADAGTYW